MRLSLQPHVLWRLMTMMIMIIIHSIAGYRIWGKVFKRFLFIAYVSSCRCAFLSFFVFVFALLGSARCDVDCHKLCEYIHLYIHLKPIGCATTVLEEKYFNNIFAATNQDPGRQAERERDRENEREKEKNRSNFNEKIICFHSNA